MDTPTIPQKQCCKKAECIHTQATGGWLPATLEYFYANSKCAGGLNTKCKECVKAYSNRWYDENKPHVLELTRTYRDSHKSERLAYLREYYNRPEVRARENERHKELRKRPDVKRKRLALQRSYRKRPEVKLMHQSPKYKAVRVVGHARRRARIKDVGGRFTAQDVLLQYRSQNGRCWHCGKLVGDDYHVDHLIPLARGGVNTSDNIVISCPPCNLSKQDKLTSEWNGRLF